MSIKHKAINSVIWSAIQNWGSQIGSLLIFFMLARLLSPEAFGLVALANVFLAFMRLFLDQGFGQAIIQRKDLEPEHLDTAFWINLAIGLSLTLVGVGISGPVAQLFGEPTLTPILRCFSLLFVVAALGQLQQSILERRFEYKLIAARWLFATVAGGGVGITMALQGWGVWSLVGQQMVSEVIGTLTLWFYSDWRPTLRVSMRHFRDLFGVGMHIMGFNYLSFFSTRANDFLVGYAFGPTELGYYTVAYSVLNAMTQILIQTSRDVALPTFSRLQEEPERFRRAFYSATQLTSALAMPTFLGMAVLAPELVKVLFGEQWLPAVPLIQVLSMLGILRSLKYFRGSVFIAMGRSDWWLWLAVLDVVLSLLAFAISYRWGIFAVALATVLRNYLVFPLGQWAICKLIQDSLGKYLRVFITPAICSLIMAAAVFGVKQGLSNSLHPMGLIMLGTISGVIFYVILIRLLAPDLFKQATEITQIIVRGSKSSGG
ncbi:MAG: flippase [Leptolyngbya sp.]|nr:MAG: flippase [Leptolyngbya sp.]